MEEGVGVGGDGRGGNLRGTIYDKFNNRYIFFFFSMTGGWSYVGIFRGDIFFGVF